MLNKGQIKARIREVEVNIEFERGRLSMVDEQAKDVEASKAINRKIREMQAALATFKEVLKG